MGLGSVMGFRLQAHPPTSLPVLLHSRCQDTTCEGTPLVSRTTTWEGTPELARTLTENAHRLYSGDTTCILDKTEEGIPIVHNLRRDIVVSQDNQEIGELLHTLFLRHPTSKETVSPKERKKKMFICLSTA